jgi:hypothetical protein
MNEPWLAVTTLKLGKGMKKRGTKKLPGILISLQTGDHPALDALHEYG